MKYSIRAFLHFAFLSLALVAIFAPMASSSCQECRLLETQQFPFYEYVCSPAFGPGYDGSCYRNENSCSISGSICEGGDPGCFLAQTMISTPNGNRPIESLKEGDEIWCVSDDGTKVAGKVVQTLKHTSNGYYRLNGSILVTGVHRFMVCGGQAQNYAAGFGPKTYEKHSLGQWIPLSDISVGQELLKIDGSRETVETIDSVDRGVRVYNLEVSPYHNYFANGVLVHNQKPDPTE